MTRLALLLLLLSLSAMVHARDVRMHGANGDGGACDTPVPVVPTPSAKRSPLPPAHAKAKAPTLFRGSDEDAGPHAPRWHSFLPGMFR